MQLMDTTTRTSRSVIGRTAATLGAAVMLSASAWSGASLTASADTETDAADTDATTTAAAAEDSSSADGRNSDVILNMFQWSWTSIAEECTSTIGPAGFGYVQVSPPQEEIQGTEWWTSYQPVSYKIEGKLGTRAEFKNMVDTCNAAGVEVIADAVINT